MIISVAITRIPAWQALRIQFRRTNLQPTLLIAFRSKMWKVVFGKNCLYDLIKQYYVEAWVIVVEHQTADVF